MQQKDSIPASLQIHPGQQRLTPEQETEATRFAEAFIQRQLSTEPADEPEAERLLRQAYAVVNLPPPARIQGVDGPLQLIARAAARGVGHSVEIAAEVSVRASLEDM